MCTMIKKGVVVLVICLWLCSGKISSKKIRTAAPTNITYPELFREHVFYSLTNKGKEQFFAVNIHPDCKAKNGYCIQRAKCNGREMLYISRVCYRWDLVCCYDNTIRYPEMAYKGYIPQAPPNFTTEAYHEEPILP